MPEESCRQVEILNLYDIDPAEWNSLLNSKNTSVFNTLEWANVWNLSYEDARPLFLVTKTNGLQSAIPLIEIKKLGVKSYHSMPYGDYGAILSSSGTNSIHSNEIKDLFSSFAKLAHGNWGMLSFSDFHEKAKELESLGFKKLDSVTHILPLSPDPTTIWENSLSQKTRNQVNQSQRNRVRISLIKDEAEVNKCYEITKHTAKRHKKTGSKFPFRFYLNIFTEMKKYLRWTLAWREKELLAYAIHFVYKDTIIWWDNGSYTQFLKYRPNNALVWDTIKWGCKNGYKHYDLGGSPNPGLSKFKQSWGAKEYCYFFYYKKSIPFKVLKALLR